MSEARQAIQAAVAAGADELVAGDVDRARTFMTGAEEALVLEQYKRARTAALAAKRTALLAHKVAVSIQTAEQLADTANGRGLDVSAARASLASARRAAEAGASTEAIRAAETASRLLRAQLE
ncbi:MAG: hypothetical protein AAF458_23060 [Pseudomonadota bacterium]